MDTRLLRVLVELERRGTLRAVAAATGYGTSAVSQQLAALEREMGTALVEPAGRKVRLTPAGRRLAEHGRRILASVAEARAALDPQGEPAGVLRIAAYAGAISHDLLPVARQLARSHPDLRPHLHEHEPDEVMSLLDDGLVDLGFVYDYNLVPWTCDGPSLLLCETPLVLVVPRNGSVPETAEFPAALAAYARSPWVLNSRGKADDELAARVCALAGFVPVVAHRADSLELVLDIVAAELGVALVPEFAADRDDVAAVPLRGLDLRRRMYAVTRPGGWNRAGVRLVVDLVAGHATGEAC
ncbi:LysR family transcriptional regulator [Sphaerisporangium fuscum]|uniref:LysR family transcriptional regulator n=1 Tax=Sphaerisporangium fuscum TaxID=2835868 RepID=UPI001BDC30B4|nr:LysR family transcriptional regulator [Sphaerisporangium fuscum]